MFGLMHIDTFAKELDDTPASTIYSWKDRGEIPLSCFKKVGGTWFVRIKEMREWLEK